MAARRRDLQGALGHLLAAYLGEVRRVARHLGGERGRVDARDRRLAQEVLNRLGETAERDHRHGAQGRRLGRIGRREQHLSRPEPVPEVRDGESPAHRADGAVQPELARDQPAGERLLGQVPVGGEHGERDRQV